MVRTPFGDEVQPPAPWPRPGDDGALLEPRPTLGCRLSWHRWGPWADLHDGLLQSVGRAGDRRTLGAVLVQERRCLDCRVSRRRLVTSIAGGNR